jgi:calcineurin-like phosphoesterase
MRFEPATKDVRLCAAVIECDETTGRAISIQRIMLDEEGNDEVRGC